ncbi:hypothetical protein L7F22_046394 [Adiantum nelumboides]|nr:hypothetical protein [Adiantum nelumboides]
MLQATILKPDKATSSQSIAAASDHFSASSTRMNVPRLRALVNRFPTGGFPKQTEYFSECFAAAELVKQPTGMSVSAGVHYKRSYVEEANRGESGEDVEWEGPTRRSKRREVSLEVESRSEGYGSLAVEQRHCFRSGGSDLTTEQSVICMAADESNSAKSSSSLDGDGCLLKLHSAVPPASCYNDLSGDTDDDDRSSKLTRTDAALSASHHIPSLHATCSSYTCFPTPSNGGHWLAATSQDACATFGDHMQHDPQGDTERHDVGEAEADWLELRLGQSAACRDDVVHMSRPTSPCTLQLLPEKPDCVLMKERGQSKELRLCCGEHYERNTSTLFAQAGHQQQGRTSARPPLISEKNYVNQPGFMRENYQHLYANKMQVRSGPMQQPDGDRTVGQYITTQGLLPIRHSMSAVERSCNPSISTMDYPSSHVQQFLQDTSFQNRQPLQVEAILQNRDASLHHALEGPRSLIKSMVCSSLHEDLIGSPIQRTRSAPLPDFLQQNWDLHASSTSSSSGLSISMLQVAATPTSFRDLIASSFVKEPLSKLEYGNGPLLPAKAKPQLNYNGDTTLNQHINIWPCPKMQYNQSSSLIGHSSDLAVNNERVVTSSVDYTNGRKSMSEWLSQALSTSTGTLFNPLTQRVLEDEVDPDQGSTNTHGNKFMHQSSLKLSTGRQAAAARRKPPGFWFALQPSGQEYEGSCRREGAGEDDVDAQQSRRRSYIRLKNGDVPLSVVKKFLLAKLGLSHDSQVGFSCRGKLLEECNYLKRIQDDIWIPPNFTQLESLNFKTRNNSSIPKDNVMILTYQIFK